MTRRLVPVALALLAITLVASATGRGTTVAGHVSAWGDNADGELGNGTVTRYGGIPDPVELSQPTGVTAVEGGSDFSLALTSDGAVWAWGNGGWGQLGQGTYGSSATPLRVSGLTSVTAIAAGNLHALALKADGTVWSWGFNYYGQVGNGTSGGNVLAPVRVTGLTGVVGVAAAAGSFTSYALKSDGTVWAWGYNGLGQLGVGSSDENPHPLPVQVSSLGDAVAIAAGSNHVLAVRAGGNVAAWGSNQFKQLGAPTSETCSSYQVPCSTRPTGVKNLSGVSSVAGGGNFSLALKSNGTVWGWGENNYGQLANGTTTPIGGLATPTKARLRSVIAIAAGDEHMLALKANGTVHAAGRNEWGQLGNGTFTDSARPVTAHVSGVTAIGSGLDHSLAIGP